jgi:hypothetical protein
VQPNYGVKESRCNGGGEVRVPEGNEMSVHGKPIKHRQNDLLAIDTGKYFDEVHGHICPPGGGHIEGLKEASRMQMVCLVLLAHGASANKILDHLLCT